MSQSPWLDNAEVVMRQGESPDPAPTKKSDDGFYSNRIKRGIATGVAQYADTPARIINLGVAGAGYLGNKLFGLNPPNLPFNANHYTEALQRVLGAGEAVEPANGTQALFGAVTEGAASGIGGGWPLGPTLNTAKTVPGAVAQYIAQQGVSGGLAGAGSEIGGQVGGTPGAILGGLVGGTVVPSSFLSGGGPVVGGVRAAVNATREMASNKATTDAATARISPIVDRMVNNQLRDAVAGTPNAAQNIDDALAVSSKIPGFKPSVAEMSGSEGASQMQTKYALTSPARMNSEIARVDANKQAIADYYKSIAPDADSPSSIRSSINQSLADSQKTAISGETSVASKLPQVDQLELGQRLTDLASKEKTAAKPAITAAYEKAFNESGAATTDVSPIVSAVEGVLGTSLSKIKPENSPQTVSAIRRIFGDQMTDASGRSIPPDLMALSEVGGKKDVTLRDLHDLRVAINQDIASAGRSLDPTASTRLFNLGKVLPQIDDAISKLPGSDAYRDANRKYSTEYAPRFKEGTNLQVFKDKSTNEPRILPDRFISEFLKPDSNAGVSRSLQFNNLFGQNPEAKSLALQGIMDVYRQKVVDPSTGVIKAQAHDDFMKNYGRTIATFESNGVPALSNLTKIGKEASAARAVTDKLAETAKSLKFDTVDDLLNAALKEPRVMANALSRMSAESRPQMARILMDRATEGGTASSIVKFLTDHEKTLKMVPGMDSQHKANLMDIAKAYEITERSPIKGGVQMGGPDLIKNATGVSTPTIQSQIRAWTGGRQAFATGALNVGIPMLYRLSQTRFSDIMEGALHNPETAKNLRDLLRANNNRQAEISAQGILDSMKDVSRLAWSARGPVIKHFVGPDKYPQNFARSGGAVAGELEEQQ